MKIRKIICLLMLGLYPQLAHSLTIVSPQAGTKITVGSLVKVQVKADAGEQLSEVKLLLADDEDFQLNPATGFYEKTIKSPVKKTGTMKIQITAMDKQGNVYQAEVEVVVTLPSTVTLTGIQASPNPVFLYKLPEGSDPNRVRAMETDSLSVSGLYSDGVKREITSSTSGTTYISSDEKVVKVDPEGKVSVQSVGKAKITIKNGKYETTVNVIAKPKN